MNEKIVSKYFNLYANDELILLAFFTFFLSWNLGQTMSIIYT